MPHFDSMIQQKILLKRKLLQNQAVVNLLCNVGNNVAEFEDFKTGSKSPAEPLIKTHFYVPGTQTDDKNFITMRSRVVYTDSNVIKETGITVYIICNEHQIDLLQGSRADLLADEVDRILNNGDKPLFGLGGIKLSTADEVQFNEGYSGWSIPYVILERDIDHAPTVFFTPLTECEVHAAVYLLINFPQLYQVETIIQSVDKTSCIELVVVV